MAINLVKGQAITLNKDEHDLSQLTIGLGWKIAQPKDAVFQRLFGNKLPELDLDAVAILLDENGKMILRGDERMIGGDVVFFNSLQHPSGNVYHSGDNRAGGTGAEDDEQIVVRLNALAERYHRILFLVCIYQGTEKRQHFGMMESAYIRAVDAQGKEIARYALHAEPAYSGSCTMIFGEVYRQGASWKFRALGESHPCDTFVPLLKKYLPN